MASKKRKRSSLSPHPHRRLRKQATTEDTIQRSGRNLWNLFSPVRSSLIAVQNTTEQKLPDEYARATVLQEELLKLGKHVEHLASEPGMTEDDKISFWLFVSSYWPYTGTRADDLRIMYDKYNRIHHQLEAEAEKASKKLNSRPFLETGLGGLAPEIRETIFINLLAIPPPYRGRDFRVEQTPMVSRPPMSLTSFVDLKASCLAVLQTCRQIYLEAFPIFYAGKSYYLANSQDLSIFFKFGGYWKVGPQLFRVDTVTSLCLKDLVTNRPKWNPQQVEYLVSRLHTANREDLEAARTTEIDFKLILVDFEEMKSLRKICLCMRVGQEWEYLRFLFNIRGLRRGVIDFADNFHWAIRSQSMLGGDWKLQYTAFPNIFYKRGKNFELLDYHDVKIQGEVLNIDSRASDLQEGDERWVEVDIGSRNYDERMPGPQQAPDVAPSQVPENQQGLPGGESVDPATNDGSDHGSEHLQEQLDVEENDTQTDNEPDQGSNYLQEQPDREEESTQIDNEQDQESDDLQGQPDGEEGGENDGAKTDDEPDQGSGYPQNLADEDDHNAQADPDKNQESGTFQRPPNKDYTGAPTETVPKEESENISGPLAIEDGTFTTATESNQGLEGAVELVDDRLPYVQADTESPQIPAIVPEDANQDCVEAQPREKTQATTDISSEFQCQNYRDAQTQTEPMDSEYRNIETQTEPGEFTKDLQGKNQMATAPIQKVSMPDQNAVYQPKIRDEQQAPAQPKLKPSKKPQDSIKSHPENETAAKSQNSPIPQKSLRMPSNPRIRQESAMPPASADNNSNTQAKRQSLLTPSTRRYLHRCVRAAALMLALSLFYVLLYAKLEGTLGQLLALLLFVQLFFVALWSESD